MKKFLVICMLLIGTVTFAQNKNAKATIEVDGVCNMCKERIEKAAIRAIGVKMANWDVNTHDLQLIYDERKTDLNKIQQSIADIGHDTKDIKATDEAYHSLHDCCLYRDEVVRDDHKTDKQ